MTFDGKLAAPKKLFQDITTLDFPAPQLDADSLAAHGVRVHTTPDLAQAAAMFDGKTDTACPLPTKGNTAATIDAETDAPYTARSLKIYPSGKPLGMTCEAQAADESGANFHTVRTVSFEHLSPTYNGGGFMTFAPVCSPPTRTGEEGTKGREDGFYFGGWRKHLPRSRRSSLFSNAHADPCLF